MKKRPYYIEFVGQHTAGKTTVIKAVVDGSLLSPLLAIYPQKLVRSRANFYWQLIPLLLKHSKNFLFVVYFLLTYAKWSWINYHAVGRHLLKMVILHPYYEDNNFDLWMKDDMLHLLPRLELRSWVDSEKIFRMFFEHFASVYDGIVYMDISYTVMQDRFKDRFSSRPVKRRRSRGPVYERAFVQNQVLKKVLLGQTVVPVLLLDGTSPVSENAQLVKEFIEKNIL